MTKNYIYSLSFFFIIVLFSSCASLTGFQDGRAVGEGNGEAMISLNASQSPSFIDLEETIDGTTGETFDIPRFLFPNIELGGRYGIADDLDVTLKLNTNLNISAGIKYQILGDRFSKYALGTGLEVGSFGLITGLFNTQIPLYASIHPTESFAFYLSPRFIYQFSSIGGLIGWNYIGGNTGLLFGSKHKFGLDFGYYQVGTSSTARIGLVTVGIGGKFFFGNNENTDVPSSRKKKKKR